MSFNGLRLEYALDGSLNYIAWKDMMEAVLEDNGLKEFIDSDVPKSGFNKMMNLVKRVAFTKWARRLFLAQVYFYTMSIFRHVNHISEFVGCYLWMVGQVGKIDEILFLESWAKSIYRS